MSWISKTEGRLAHWLSVDGGRGFFVCIVVLGLLAYGGQLLVPNSLPALHNADLWTAPLVTLAQAFAAGGLALSVAFSILALVSCSQRLRILTRTICAFCSDIPVLGGVSLVLGLCLPFSAVVAITAFSLCVRIVRAALNEEENIPSSYLKTAQSLRLKTWQCFWRIHMPVAFPKIAQTILEDVPDFWLRLLGAQALLAMIEPHYSSGCGAQAFEALMQHKMGLFCWALGAMFLIRALVYQAVIGPLVQRSHRYHTPPHLAPSLHDDGETLWWKKSLVWLFLVSGLLIFWTIITPLHSWFFFLREGGVFLISSLIILTCCAALWTVLGGYMIGKRGNLRRLFHLLSALFLMSPFVFLEPFFHSYIAFVICLILSLQGAFGWSILAKDEGKHQKRLYRTARHLRVPPFSFWQKIRLPLALPAVSRGALYTLSPMWNSLYLGGALSPLVWVAFREGSFSKQPAETFSLLIIMTSCALIVRHAIACPLQRYLLRKYKVSP
ncbi:MULTISPECIES: hypothetical protein [unclassified Saccharibacter]|uniref:hypothetical protein n=1 Tax=unclassified Saccharibacter TaxID=2648722 RepID=UPI001328FBCF|nr:MULTISPECIES: hypothetical protein [unclassified Saccharibacter]MXV35275.1 hypothetical protein [Saccharibacter sp. EH611]MXV57877.1 hypothetical protein [Saccharibacter sp. EH70]MXV65209.1 hypothetical protein [Saccharibacter sp. EH60]